MVTYKKWTRRWKENSYETHMLSGPLCTIACVPACWWGLREVTLRLTLGLQSRRVLIEGPTEIRISKNGRQDIQRSKEEITLIKGILRGEDINQSSRSMLALPSSSLPSRVCSAQSFNMHKELSTLKRAWKRMAGDVGSLSYFIFLLRWNPHNRKLILLKWTIQ